MTTPPYGETDPLASASFEPTTTPIGDELAHDSGIGTSSGSRDSSASTGSAKEKAQDALGSTSEHGAQVAETAKDEAAKVAAEAKDKATDLLADVRSQVDEQSKAQLQGLASKLGELADEIESMVSSSEAGGTVTDLAQQLADKTHQLSSHLKSRQPLDLLDDVRALARRRPAAFLAGAAVAGVVAGRLTRGAKTTATPGAGSTLSTASTAGTGRVSSGQGLPGTTSPVPTAPVTSPPTIGGGAVSGAPDVPGGQNTGGRQ